MKKINNRIKLYTICILLLLAACNRWQKEPLQIVVESNYDSARSASSIQADSQLSNELQSTQIQLIDEEDIDDNFAQEQERSLMESNQTPYARYLGVWYSDDDKLDDLSIYSITEEYVCFSMDIYRIASITAIAECYDEVFKFNSFGPPLSGSIRLYDAFITVTIERSNFDYIKKGETFTFIIETEKDTNSEFQVNLEDTPIEEFIVSEQQNSNCYNRESKNNHTITEIQKYVNIIKEEQNSYTHIEGNEYADYLNNEKLVIRCGSIYYAEIEGPIIFTLFLNEYEELMYAEVIQYRHPYYTIYFENDNVLCLYFGEEIYRDTSEMNENMLNAISLCLTSAYRENEINSLMMMPQDK